MSEDHDHYRAEASEFFSKIKNLESDGLTVWDLILARIDRNRDLLNLPDINKVLSVEPPESDIGIYPPLGPVSITYETYDGEIKSYSYPGPMVDLTGGLMDDVWNYS